MRRKIFSEHLIAFINHNSGCNVINALRTCNYYLYTLIAILTETIIASMKSNFCKLKYYYKKKSSYAKMCSAMCTMSTDIQTNFSFYFERYIFSNYFVHFSWRQNDIQKLYFFFQKNIFVFLSQSKNFEIGIYLTKCFQRINSARLDEAAICISPIMWRVTFSYLLRYSIFSEC